MLVLFEEKEHRLFSYSPEEKKRRGAFLGRRHAEGFILLPCAPEGREEVPVWRVLRGGKEGGGRRKGLRIEKDREPFCTGKRKSFIITLGERGEGTPRLAFVYKKARKNRKRARGVSSKGGGIPQRFRKRTAPAFFSQRGERKRSVVRKGRGGKRRSMTLAEEGQKASLSLRRIWVGLARGGGKGRE